jgi:uncharacterized membrane protein
MDTKPNTVPGPSGAPDPRGGSPPAPRSGFWRGVCDRIIGGLILVLPFMITLWILRWIYSFLEKNVIDPLAMVVLWKLKWTTSSTELPYWFETFAAPVIAIILALVLLYLIDYYADTRLRRAVAWLLTRVPVISHVYNPVRNVFQSLEKQSEQQVPKRLVLVPFPHIGMKLPAFVTSSCRDCETKKVILCVYVPTTPVPTSGFFLMVPEEEVTELNWGSEQALQAIVSGGLTAPAEVSYFKPKTAIASKPAVTNVTDDASPKPPDDGRSQPA